MNDQQSPKAKAARWKLWRQDDNGVRILISCYTDRDVGSDELRRFESRQHKQTYWLREVPVEAGS